MNIFITGANRGLGYALAKAAVSRGHHVLAGTRSLENGAQDLEKLRSETPERLTLVKCDVTDEETVRSAAEFVADKAGQLDVIINNAAILLGRDDSIEQLDLQMMVDSMDVNLYGPMRVVKHFMPLLQKNGGGYIVNISSEAGSFQRAYAGDYPYAISKTALNMFTQQLHKGLSNEGIRAVAVHPGWMRTDMGGSQAALDPMESAAAILDIAEGKDIENEPFAFVDYTGKAFPI